MIWIAFGEWSSSSGSMFTRQRIYLHGYRWTPFVSVRWRYGWFCRNQPRGGTR